LSLTLYHCPDWASSIIRLALEELGLAYTIHPMDWDAGDFDTPAFRAINPLGLIPAMDTPDGRIFETAAILLWLVESHGRLGPPPGDPDRAAFLTWLFFVSNTLHVSVMTLVHPERPAGDAAAAEVQRLALERLNTEAAELETLITDRAPRWLSATEPGVLGYYLGIILRWAMDMPADAAMRFDLRPFPALRAVLAAHEGFPAARRVAEADGLGPHPFTAPEGAA
jgi:glutathione S-transferase